MVWILRTILILLRCKNSSHRFQKRIGPLAVSIQRVSPFYRTSQFSDSAEFDFRVWFSPGFLMQWKIARRESFHCIARPNSSLVSTLTSRLCCDSFLHLILFCVLFDITSEHSAELKWPMLNKTQKIIPLITCEIPLDQHVCELVFGVNIFNLDLAVQIDSIEQPIKSNSVGSGNMSQCRTSSTYDHFDHCFVVFKHIQQSFLMWRLDVWGTKINIIQNIDHSSRLVAFLNRVRGNNGSPCSIMVLSCVSKDWNNQIP